MAYDEKDAKRLRALLESIPERITYRETPKLREIEQTLTRHLAQETPADKETLADSVAILRYLAVCYERLGRFSVAAQFFDRALALAAQLYREFGEETKYAGEMLYRALKAHNYYVDDDCEQLLGLCRDCLPKADEIAQGALNPRRHLKHDPVEMTGAYLAVIDEAEEYVEKKRRIRGLGACYEVWNLKQKFLMEHGVDWHSPAVLNPQVRFD